MLAGRAQCRQKLSSRAYQTLLHLCFLLPNLKLSFLLLRADLGSLLDPRISSNPRFLAFKARIIVRAGSNIASALTSIPIPTLSDVAVGADADAEAAASGSIHETLFKI